MMKQGRLKILIVAFSDSIHTARWISQLNRSKYEIHLFQSVPFRQIHSELKGIHIWGWIRQIGKQNNDLVIRNPNVFLRAFEKLFGSKNAGKVANGFRLDYKNSLLKTIRTINPDIIHSMETQKAGYLVSKLKNHINGKWVHSNWGIDLHYFADIPEHGKKIIKLLTQVDVLVAEGERDLEIATGLGFKGEGFVIPSVGGGLDFELFDSIGSKIKPSLRRIILLKGYEGDERLASKALSALRIISNKLRNFEVIVYSCSFKLLPLINEIQSKKEFPLTTLTHIEYKELLGILPLARVSITNNLSDGVPNTMLEAMAFGTFPIQSNTAITEGWIEDGVNGLLTIPTDEINIANAISRALADDDMVDKAADYNRNLVRTKLNKEIIEKEIDRIYTNL